MPLESLWDDDGNIEAKRERFLSREGLQALLHQHPVEFIVADMGSPLRSVEVHKCYEFWKSEVQAHIVEDAEAGFRLEDYPGNYAYIASEWTGEIQTPIVLLEKHH